MSKVASTLGGLALCTGLLVVAGCSPSSSQSTEQIKGMAPGEYREKAEMSREIPASGPKAKGRPIR
jgi:hypothetical protein